MFPGIEKLGFGAVIVDLQLAVGAVAVALLPFAQQVAAAKAIVLVSRAIDLPLNRRLSGGVRLPI